MPAQTRRIWHPDPIKPQCPPSGAAQRRVARAVAAFDRDTRIPLLSTAQVTRPILILLVLALLCLTTLAVMAKPALSAEAGAGYALPPRSELSGMLQLAQAPAPQAPANSSPAPAAPAAVPSPAPLPQPAPVPAPPGSAADVPKEKAAVPASSDTALVRTCKLRALAVLRQRSPSIEDIFIDVDGLTVAEADSTVGTERVRHVLMGEAYIQRDKTDKVHRFLCLTGDEGKVLMTFFTER
ncbi:hypothetical protein [Roseixanthobacter glucoisosaccharinicivorans]|uniref:hypothetical protein n=1 Tax=Roseixanthobacter glucoisosaccharinicivorans TaxID=3119923 RepID=UPI0037283889